MIHSEHLRWAIDQFLYGFETENSPNSDDTVFEAPANSNMSIAPE